MVSDLSDHFINFYQIPTNNDKNTQKLQSSRKFSSTNMDRFKILLRGTDWTNVVQLLDVDEAFGAFWNEFNQLYNLCFPITITKLNRNVHRLNGYMTAGLLISRSTKNKLHHTALTDPSPMNITKFKFYRNLYNTLIRKSKKLYFEESLNANVKNPKKTWEILKEATFGSKSTTKIDKISSNGNVISDPVTIAEEFNSFFTSVGTSISESVNPTIIDPINLLPVNPNLTELQFAVIGPSLLCDLIKSFETKTSCDLDGLSIKLLKHIIHEISTPLAHIFNLSIDLGSFPTQLKTSRTIPIFKSGSRLMCDNYRPISLLSTLSKLLEKIICKQLVNHLESNNLLYMHQYGFQHGKSTEHNLLQFTNYINTALNEKKYAIGIFLDLKKAFDVCSHSILLNKLKKLGIRGTAHKWFSSYLKNRKQRVDINGHLSSSKALDISVLQGSILGPILFLCYINDLHLCTNLFTTMFADDTAGADADTDLNTLIDRANIELKKLATWFRANKMAVNIGKTKFIIFHNKGKNICMDNKNILFDDNEPNSHDPLLITPLERYHSNHIKPECRAYKLLGIYLDEHLNFNYHTNYLCNKLTRSLFCIRRAKNQLTQTALKTLYFAFIQSHLNYCPIILSSISQQNFNRIKLIQKKAIRVITNSTYTAHTTPLFAKLQILPYDLLVKQAKLLFMHSIEYNRAPESFSNVWKKNSANQGNRLLRNANDYMLPGPHTELFKKSPLYTLPLEWNNMDENKYIPNRTTFKTAVKFKLLHEIINEFGEGVDPPPV